MAALPQPPATTEQEFSVMTDENGELDMSTVKEVTGQSLPEDREFIGVPKKGEVDRRTATMEQILNAPGNRETAEVSVEVKA